ncbi:MAG: site-specific DNA-methyltransferase [Verrucomicrobiales bacterium]|jgi:adenine specific DNA methylase Mod|nr:site-specific DNA-methyltransferase [Verrucomicrobiales bacterium]
MPALNWIGKEAVVNHHLAVPFHLLKDAPELAGGDADGGNLIVEGDNLVALKALLPYYKGQVKCVCIDPPYNTGEQVWTYNDHVNSPIIKKWLGETVGKEGETLDRHDRWLCMMYPRLALLREFLSDDGFIFICIDDVELYNLKLMCDEIFLASRFVGTFVWKSRRNLDSRHKMNISIDHEYVLAYRGASARLRGAAKDMNKYSNPDNDPRGNWMSDNLVGLATKDRRPNLHYDLIDPATKINYGCPKKGWRYSRETMSKKIREDRIIWPKVPTGRPRHKKFQTDLESDFTGFSSIIDCGNTNEGTEQVSEIMGTPQFIFPKPCSLFQKLIEQATNPGDLVMDSFAGSGTTGLAVLKLNNQYNSLNVNELQIAPPPQHSHYQRIATHHQRRRHAGLFSSKWSHALPATSRRSASGAWRRVTPPLTVSGCPASAAGFVTRSWARRCLTPAGKSARR